jgi:hypothetical protein
MTTTVGAIVWIRKGRSPRRFCWISTRLHCYLCYPKETALASRRGSACWDLVHQDSGRLPLQPDQACDCVFHCHRHEYLHIAPVEEHFHSHSRDSRNVHGHQEASHPVPNGVYQTLLAFHEAAAVCALVGELDRPQCMPSCCSEA